MGLRLPPVRRSVHDPEGERCWENQPSNMSSMCMSWRPSAHAHREGVWADAHRKRCPSLHNCAAFQLANPSAPSVQLVCCLTACRPDAPMCSRSTAGHIGPAVHIVTLRFVCLQAHAPMYINKHVWEESKTPVKYVANPADGERAAALLKVLTGSEELPEMPLSGKEALVTPRSAADALRRCLLWLKRCCRWSFCLVAISAGRHSLCAKDNHGQLTMVPLMPIFLLLQERGS